MVSKGMVSKSKYWISEKIRVMSTQKCRKKPYARVLVLGQVPLETTMRVFQFKTSTCSLAIIYEDMCDDYKLAINFFVLGKIGFYIIQEQVD